MAKLIVAGPFAAPEHALPGHPERPSRVDAAAAGVDDLDLGTDRVDITSRLATFDELATVHDAAYLRELEAFCAAGGGRLDPDTYAGRHSWDAARQTAGAGLVRDRSARERRRRRRVRRARPPGHHALARPRDGLLPPQQRRGRGRDVGGRGRARDDRRLGRASRQRHRGAVLGRRPRAVTCRRTRIASIRARARSTRSAVATRAASPSTSRSRPARRATSRRARSKKSSHRSPIASRPRGCSCRPASTRTATIRSPTSRCRAATSRASRRSCRASRRAPGRLAIFLEGGYDLDAIRSSVTATLGAVLDAAGRRRAGDQRRARHRSRGPRPLGATGVSGPIGLREAHCFGNSGEYTLRQAPKCADEGPDSRIGGRPRATRRPTCTRCLHRHHASHAFCVRAPS